MAVVSCFACNGANRRGEAEDEEEEEEAVRAAVPGPGRCFAAVYCKLFSSRSCQLASGASEERSRRAVHP